MNINYTRRTPCPSKYPQNSFNCKCITAVICSCPTRHYPVYIMSFQLLRVTFRFSRKMSQSQCANYTWTFTSFYWKCKMCFSLRFKCTALHRCTVNTDQWRRPWPTSDMLLWSYFKRRKGGWTKGMCEMMSPKSYGSHTALAVLDT